MKAKHSLLAVGTFLAVATTAFAAVRHVNSSSANPTPPYTNWATAATVIQDAVDAAVAGDEIIVTNGTYTTGGRAVGTNRLVNRVAVNKPLIPRSVNGPQFTVIQGCQVPGTTNGDGAIRCVYLADGASLFGFTLTNGATRDWTWTGDYDDREYNGGGVWCESTNAVVSNCVVAANATAGSGGGAARGTLHNCTLSGNSATGRGGGAIWSSLNNCILTGNSADGGGGAEWAALNHCTLTGNSARYGGGADNCTLDDCLLTGNSAGGWGGGACGGTLNNCSLAGNSAPRGGGVADSMMAAILNNCVLIGNSASECGGGAAYGALNNCIVYFNTAMDGANYYQGQYGVGVNSCCTTPQPTSDFGNITNAPLFVDYPGGNLRLQSNSPCINAGLNAYAPAPRTWTASLASSAARWTSAPTSSKATACPPTAWRILRMAMLMA